MCFFSGFVSKENNFKWQLVIINIYKQSDRCLRVQSQMCQSVVRLD